MKKIFTLIAGVLLAVGVNAQTTYNLGGKAVADFDLGDGFADGGTWVDEGGSYGAANTAYATISYTKKDKNSWSDLKLNGTPVVFQFKNSGEKKQFYRLFDNFFYANGKQSRITVTGLSAGQTVTFVAAGKNADGCLFAAIDNCTADAANPTSAVAKETDVANFANFKFAVTADGSITVEEQSAGFHLASIIVEGEGGGETDPVQTAAINYPTTKDGITLNTTDADQVLYATVKIHENTDAIDCIKFGKSYKYAADTEYYYATLTVDGGFKAGDVITIAGAYNNADTKNAAIAFRSDPASAEPLWKTEDFINGRTSADEPVKQTYTLTEDAEALYIGRAGNTGTCVTLLKVTRDTETGIVELPVSIKANDAIYNMQGQRVDANYRGVVIKNGKKTIQK